MRIRQIGRPDKDNMLNWIATFDSKDERNKVLFAKGDLKRDNIPKGCTMLRDIPEDYRQKYRDFEIKSNNIALITQYTARAFTEFEGTTLVLKMSEKGSTKRQLIESYDPCRDNARDREKNTLLKMFEPDSQSMRTVLMSSIAEGTTKEKLEQDIRELLDSKQSMIESVEITSKRSALILCKKRADAIECKNILSTEQKGATTKRVFCNELCSQK